MMRKLRFCWLLLICCMSSAFAVTSPVVMLQTTSDQAITELQKNRATLKTNPQVVYKIIDRIILPHADTEDMAKIALGRDAWMKATPAQRARFTKEFTMVIARTYASALAAYKDETVKFLPLRDDYTQKNRLQIETLIIRDGGPSVPVNYRVVLKGNEWKVYDINVEGISMLESFRSQFADELSQGDIDALLTKLSDHNQRLSRGTNG